MVSSKKYYRVLALFAALCVMGMLLTSCGFRRKKYDNPITKDTQQPDKVLFDKAVNDIEHGRYEVARLTLNTMINTYDTSEFLAKAKLAVADSWYREGGTHGLAQAEAEYKDFILFYPTMEESAESQWKVCQIHYKQMEKADRDPTQSQRAEDECRQVLVQFPNSKFVKQAEQMLRNVQEVLAEKEFRTGSFYHTRAAYPAAANRLSYVVDQYPLYSGADEALWQLADSYQKLGDRWEDKAAQAYSRIVKDYPLSAHADEAKDKLEAMKRPVPQADPAAVARMQYEAEHRTKTSTVGHVAGPVKGVMGHGPDTRMAAKTGAPSMETLRPPTPISVPATASGPGTTGGVVSASQTGGTEIDSKPDARQGGAAGAAAAASGAGGGSSVAATPAGASAGSPAATDGSAAAPAQAPLPTNYQTKMKKQKEKKPKKQPKTVTPAPAAAAAPTTGASTAPKSNPPQ